jgi:quercetin dioxygenase-like cupin family protein
MPGHRIPRVLREGEGPAYIVAGQVVRMLATSDETDGAFGLVSCQALRDRMAIPLHWHAREHDTWFCTRGRINVWGNGQGRVLYPGDFAYVPPGHVHAYQCVGQNNEFFGLVAPGGWEAFFGDAGTAWHQPGIPPAGSQPFDIGRMIAAQAKHGVNRVDQPYPDITTGADDTLPATPDSYFLQSGNGVRATLWGALFTKIIGTAQTGGAFSMHVVEAPRDAFLPMRTQSETFEAVHVLAGRLTLSLAGRDHMLGEGDTALIPGGTRQATRIESAAARWISATAGGQAANLPEAAGHAAQSYSYPLGDAAADPGDLREKAAGLDIILEG